MRASLAPVCALACLLAGCGYRIAGHADLVPKGIQTIAIPHFANLTTHYQLTDRLPEAISREFIARTRYQIVTDQNQADAILRGSVIRFFSYPIILEQSGRATGVQFIVTMQVSLIDRRTGKTIWERPTFDMRQQYEISVTPRAYFDESGAAIDRLCRDTAQSVVTAILTNF